MQELIQKLQDEHGISSEQSHGIINTITSYIKQQVPLVGGMLDHFLHTGSADTVPPNDTNITQSAGNNNESTLQKLEEFAKGKLGSIMGS